MGTNRMAQQERQAEKMPRPPKSSTFREKEEFTPAQQEEVPFVPVRYNMLPARTFYAVHHCNESGAGERAEIYFDFNTMRPYFSMEDKTPLPCTITAESPSWVEFTVEDKDVGGHYRTSFNTAALLRREAIQTR